MANKNTIPTRMNPEFNKFARLISAQRIINGVEERPISPAEVGRMIPNVSCKDILFKELTTKPRRKII